jgi:hypothetical protein
MRLRRSRMRLRELGESPDRLSLVTFREKKEDGTTRGELHSAIRERRDFKGSGGRVKKMRTGRRADQPQ